jgi:hypothetical protein
MTSPGSARFRRIFALTYSDALFISLVGWLFLFGYGWEALLADGDTGWHIRTGEYILDHARLPAGDLYSFTRPGAAWYAWEWLSDVAFALCFRWSGLKGVTLLAGLAIVAYLTLMVRRSLRLGANAFVALACCLVGAGASSIHFLARPHVFTLLLLMVSLGLLERDRARPGLAVWWLVPITALWANLHAGFLAMLACLALMAVGEAVETAWACGSVRVVLHAASRKAGLFAACVAASVANPYGVGLHRHVIEYLKSDWIKEAVDEFQSPRFRSESALQFEVLLFVGLIAAGMMLRRRRIADALIVLAWAHAALISVRHVPVFVAVAVPIVAAEASRWWAEWTRGASPRSVPGIFDALASDVGKGFARSSVWPVAVVVALVFVNQPIRWPRDFPAAKFPVALIAKHEARLAGARVFTSDQWGDYLLYRFHPRQRVFIDGRSDFYGREIGKLYLRTAYAHKGWRGALDRYGVALALTPEDWPLAAALSEDLGWRELDRAGGAILYERVVSLRGNRGISYAEVR